MEPNPNQPAINRALNLISEVTNLLTASSPTAAGNLGVLGQPQNILQQAPVASRASVLASEASSTNRSIGPQTPTTSTNVLGELRRSFQPYPRPVPRGRNTGRPVVRASRPTVPWSHRFCCLGGPSDTCTPSRERLSILQQHQLGHDHIFTDRNATKEELISKLEEAFPLLNGESFEMLQTVGSGGGTGKPLRRLSSQHQALSVPMILQSRILSIIYIRPEIDLIQDSDEIECEASQNSILEEDEAVALGQVEANTARRAQTPVQMSVGIVDQVPNTSTSEIYAGFATMAELTESLHSENPGEQLVAVQRDDFCAQVLGVYKNPGFDLLKKPMVVFIGEPGRDVGALTKEYFWRGMSELMTGKVSNLPLFEGERDHKVPSCDSVLLRSGKFKEVGRFICHAALHTGIGFIGLSPAVTEYICAKEITSDSIFPITISDVPDSDKRDIIEEIELWRTTRSTPSSEVQDKIYDTATEAGFHVDLNLQNLSMLREQLLYFHVIEKRKAQLDSIKEGFKGTPFLNFLANRSYLISSVFPQTTSMDIPLNLLLEKIEVSGDSEENHVARFMQQFITKVVEDGRTLDLLNCWTGWPILPDGQLKVTVVDNGPFMIRSCFCEIEIPKVIPAQQLYSLMNMALEHASAGFGSV